MSINHKVRLLKTNSRGFSLVEIIVAATILVTLVPFIVSAFLSAGKWMKPTSHISTNVVRDQLEALYQEVRADEWDQAGTDLSVGSHTVNPGTEAGYSDTYTRTYTVADVSGRDYRKVAVTADDGT